MAGRPDEVTDETAALSAWNSFVRTHSMLTRDLDRALQSGAGMPLVWYDALAAIAASPNKRIRLNELEEHVMLSQSGVSRLAARLVEAGLIERSVPKEDRRAVEVRLTRQGNSKLNAARKVQSTQLRDLWVAQMSEREAKALRKVLDRVRGEG